jgi:hypothetical protein
MMHKSLILAAIAATLVATSVAVPSSAEARTHHRLSRQFAHVYGYAPWYGYAPRYGYARNPVQPWEYPFHGRIDSNLNPDRQMVGVND